MAFDEAEETESPALAGQEVVDLEAGVVCFAGRLPAQQYSPLVGGGKARQLHRQHRSARYGCPYPPEKGAGQSKAAHEQAQ